MNTSKPPISDSDYRRIFSVIYSVLESEQADIAKSCVFFSMAGAAILEHHYKIRAFPIAGAALYVLDNKTQAVLAFASQDPSEGPSSRSSFHCWTQCEDFVIDFMAPLFPESMPNSIQIVVPRRIFKKPLSSMAPRIEELINDGDFILLRDIDLTQNIIDGYKKKRAAIDLINICLHWYKRPPLKIPASVKIGDQHGSLKTIRLLQLPISGSW